MLVSCAFSVKYIWPECGGKSQRGMSPVAACDAPLLCMFLLMAMAMEEWPVLHRVSD